MRRILALLAVALLFWLVARIQSTSTSEVTSPAPTSAVPHAPSPVPLPVDAERTEANAAQSPQTGPPASTARRRSQASSAKSERGFRDRAHLHDHFTKHGGEFPGFNEAEYLAMAQILRDAPAGGDILEVIRGSDGVVSRFDRRTGAFLAFDRDGTIRTFFKPNDGEKYFRRQANRAPTP